MGGAGGSRMHASRHLIRTIALTTALVSIFALRAPASAQMLSPAAIEGIVRTAMAKNHLRAAIVQVRSNGTNVYTGAIGDSMAGVPATPDMHFRNGALAFTYMATLLLEFVDQKKVTLDTKLSTYFPELPNADLITMRNLAQMTSGYADYVYQQELLQGLYLDPFRQFTPQETDPHRRVKTHGVRSRYELGLLAHELRHPGPGAAEDRGHAARRCASPRRVGADGP